ncbi:penicillin acylase family protein [Aquirufa aurantiipilula]|uniref:penicillin acylase family protein n=2 Tax=Aquirufa aurantiipilula TaxID=2696561 RepID=UPI001CAA46F3|nr:penicillin acylase family protein [Aquirufa aurantiipilula]
MKLSIQRIICLAFVLMTQCNLMAQTYSFPIIRTDKIQIARDSYGVPHIFAPTDPEVAYGLAWAHAEDDFKTIQTLILTGKGKLGTYLGKKGAPVDYVFGLLQTKKVVEEQISTMDPKFILLIKGYLLGLTAYAEAHPKEVLNKHVFPISVEEYLSTTVFSVAVFCGVERTLPKLLNGSIATLPGFTGEGSNSFAIHANKSESGENMLVINAHQPIEGATAFYEAHLQSEEGWNMLGGLFPGAPLIFHGTGPNLAWAHTVNFQDKIDVYQLKTDAKHPGMYQVDGEWLPLEKRKIKLKIKGLPISISKMAYRSIYGPTVKGPKGAYFSMRLPSLMDSKALEQWYHMNRANNFTEFKKALEENHLAMFNILYADKESNIFYVSNGKMPYRNPDKQYHWASTLPGNTKASLWTSFKPFSALPQYHNPSSGYLFNTNHSPFLATAEKENLNPKDFDANDGYELYHNNRSVRARELLEAEEKISYQELKRIKFDRQLPKKIVFPYGYAADSLFSVQASKYPHVQALIEKLQAWDHVASPESQGALIYLMAYYHVPKIMAGRQDQTLTSTEAVQVFEHIQKTLMQHFKRTDLTLGEVQRLVRGKENWPQGGMPDVLAAVMSVEMEGGKRRMNSGDAYIQFVRFPKDGGLPFIESVNTFGASSNPESAHFADQRPLYQAQQVKPMTLDKKAVLEQAKRVYHPE